VTQIAGTGTLSRLHLTAVDPVSMQQIGSCPTRYALGLRAPLGTRLEEITHLLVTHYHPDHAGLAQELKHEGVRLVVLENQAAGIAALKRYMKPHHHYVDIALDDNILVRSELAAAAVFILIMLIRMHPGWGRA